MVYLRWDKFILTRSEDLRLSACYILYTYTIIQILLSGKQFADAQSYYAIELIKKIFLSVDNLILTGNYKRDK